MRQQLLALWQSRLPSCHPSGTKLFPMMASLSTWSIWIWMSFCLRMEFLPALLTWIWTRIHSCLWLSWKGRNLLVLPLVLLHHPLPLQFTNLNQPPAQVDGVIWGSEGLLSVVLILKGASLDQRGDMLTLSVSSGSLNSTNMLNESFSSCVNSWRCYLSFSPLPILWRVSINVQSVCLSVCSLFCFWNYRKQQHKVFAFLVLLIPRKWEAGHIVKVFSQVILQQIW